MAHTSAQEAVSHMSSALTHHTEEEEGQGEEGGDTVGLICLAAQVAFEVCIPQEPHTDALADRYS